jgi:ABC-2 type transport system permease protein
VLTSITTGLAGFLAVVTIAGVIFGYNILRIGVMLVPFMFILLIFGIAMAFLCPPSFSASDHQPNGLVGPFL